MKINRTKVNVVAETRSVFGCKDVWHTTDEKLLSIYILVLSHFSVEGKIQLKNIERHRLRKTRNKTAKANTQYKIAHNSIDKCTSDQARKKEEVVVLVEEKEQKNGNGKTKWSKPKKAKASTFFLRTFLNLNISLHSFFSSFQ